MRYEGIDETTAARTHIYVDFPFCPVVCTFCAFYPVLDRTGAWERRYVDLLLREIDLLGERYARPTRMVRALEFGGGTPTQLPAAELARVAEALTRRFWFAADAERNFETTPDRILGGEGVSRLTALKEAGFNRVSIGTQSFDGQVLKHANRSHTARETQRAVDAARSAAFTRLNIDLMVGLRGQSLESFRDSVEKCLEPQPDVIEVYHMRFFDTKRPVPMTQAYLRAPHEFMSAEDILVARMYAHLRFVEAGYEGCNGRTYFRRRGPDDFFSDFYREHFRGQNILGIGRKSHSFVYPFQYGNYRNLEKYAAALERHRLPIAAGIRFDDRARLGKLITGGLQLPGAFDFAAACARFPGIDPGPFDELFRRLCDGGLLSRSAAGFRKTEAGAFHIEEILKSFYDLSCTPFNARARFHGQAQRTAASPSSATTPFSVAGDQ
jgi:oxygen-independent coproporphyrinogen-3 oxidase